MKEEILKLEPHQLWRHFYTLTQIPRPSGHERAVIEYIRDFAKQRNLEHHIDKTGNIIVRKQASSGRQMAKNVVMQSHVDMVPQKNNDKVHNFITDPIEPIIDGEWLKANQTTLGADNGIGVSAILAVLESEEILHGNIDALFTVSEETGMDGAFGLPPDLLKGEILLNLDSEDEGELFVGCAGGLDVDINWSYDESETDTRKSFVIEIKGLKGGHSGIDINLGRANANKLMIEVLLNLQHVFNMGLVSFHGGNLRNAIPREALATVVVPREQEDIFHSEIKAIEKFIRERYTITDENITITVKETGAPDKVMVAQDLLKFLNALNACPDGVIRMSDTFSGQVLTSTNLSVVSVKNGMGEFKFLLRSSDDAEKRTLGGQLESLFALINAKTEFAGEYPGWNPNPQSFILSKAKECYARKYGVEPRVNVIHAGLECGIIGGKYPSMDMISFGPTIQHPHSPDERVNIATVAKFWDFLVDVLESV